jgi:hypothetical protein
MDRRKVRTLFLISKVGENVQKKVIDGTALDKEKPPGFAFGEIPGPSIK